MGQQRAMLCAPFGLIPGPYKEEANSGLLIHEEGRKYSITTRQAMRIQGHQMAHRITLS